jgi:hypothetical protein
LFRSGSLINREDDYWPIIPLPGQTSEDIVVHKKTPDCELRDVIFSFARALFLQQSVRAFYGVIRAGVVSVFLAFNSI